MQHKKQDILMKGVGLHLAAYAAIALLLSMLDVPGVIIFMVITVLLWGLFVLSYAFYNEK